MASALSVLEGKRCSYEEFWALKEVSFELEHGESMGIIGPNGNKRVPLPAAGITTLRTEIN
jgi:ABC-type polysaccharide/polyol phosphate transport system ATPase subunit